VCISSANAQTNQRINARINARIISLKPNITEILFALGVGDRVVGVTTWCDRPPETKKLPKVADYISINTERILSLKPDLIIGSEENSIKSQFDIFKDAGIKTMTVPFTNLDDLYSSIEKIAEAVGKKTKGQELIDDIKNDIGSAGEKACKSIDLRTRELANLRTWGHADLPTVLILVGHRPFITAGQASFIGEIVRSAGGENVVKSRLPYPVVNSEFILAKAPDLILDLSMGSEAEKQLPLPEKTRIIKLDMSDFRAGPNIGTSIKKIRGMIEQNER